MTLKPIRDTYRRLRYGSPVVIVSGLPRSGTSMMMKMLEAGGLEIWTDSVRRADEDNPKGYFELERVKELEKTRDKAWVADARGKVVKVISQLLKQLPVGNFYQVLFMTRDLQEIMASQNRMLERRGEPFDPSRDEHFIELFENHLWRIRRWLSNQANFEVLEVPYREVIGDPQDYAAKVRDFLDRDLNLEKMAEAVDPALYRNRV